MSKCIYPDWEFGMTVSGEHNYGIDGYCIICGHYDKTKIFPNGSIKLIAVNDVPVPEMKNDVPEKPPLPTYKTEKIPLDELAQQIFNKKGIRNGT